MFELTISWCLQVRSSIEHGGLIREHGTNEWVDFTENLGMEWMGEVIEIFKFYLERTTGNHIETKKSSVAWHYRATDPEWGMSSCLLHKR